VADRPAIDHALKQRDVINFVCAADRYEGRAAPIPVIGFAVLVSGSKDSLVFAGRIPNLLIVTLHVISPALFALVHGARIYGSRGILIFATLCLSVGTLLEAVSLRAGFPFGYYRFTELMGPKFFDLPILLALAYVGMGYLSWILAVVILDCQNEPLSGRKIVFVAGGRKLRHDGLGLFHGGGLGRHRSRLGVARRRLVLWSVG
jgi:hypothetical protein